jgi:hypothetical protein
MKDTQIPSPEELEQISPEGDNVVLREPTEGYRINIYKISTTPSSSTEARTYTRTFGHYFVEPQSEATEQLDEFVSEFTTDNSILTSFQRYVGDQYEVTVEVTDDITQRDYQFTGSREAYLEIPSHSRYVEDLDDILSSIKEDISD